MSEPMWTPGPWRRGSNEDNLSVQPWSGAIPIEAPEDEGGGLATPSIVAWTTRGGPTKANACLIAAAPELYEALQYIFDHIADEDRGPADLYRAFGLNSGRALAKARAALAKARGETPP